MRIALCLSGTPRFVEECYPSIRNNILAANENVDVFCEVVRNPIGYQHKFSSKTYDPGWASYTTEDNKALEFIEKYYQPKTIEVSDGIEYKNKDIDTNETYKKYYREDLVGNNEFRRFQIRNSYGMFASILKCNILKKNYERANNFTYDYVIRSRYDVFIGRPVICPQFDPKFLWYEEMGQPDQMISDWFNLSNSKNMDVYSSVYNMWEVLYGRLMTKMGRWCNELLVKEILETFDVPTKSTYLALSLPRR